MQLEHIVLVEDDADIQEIAKLALSSIGNFSVKICSSGSEALQLLQDFKPQLILLDVMMPNMDGPTVLEKIKKNPSLADLPVIFMTAKVQPEEIKSYLQMGACGVISKPFNPLSLSETIQKIWEEHHKNS